MEGYMEGVMEARIGLEVEMREGTTGMKGSSSEPWWATDDAIAVAAAVAGAGAGVVASTIVVVVAVVAVASLKAVPASVIPVSVESL
jgi:hypothetical protein